MKCNIRKHSQKNTTFFLVPGWRGREEVKFRNTGREEVNLRKTGGATPPHLTEVFYMKTETFTIQVNYLLFWIASSLWPLPCLASKEEIVDTEGQCIP